MISSFHISEAKPTFFVETRPDGSGILASSWEDALAKAACKGNPYHEADDHGMPRISYSVYRIAVALQDGMRTKEREA